MMAILFVTVRPISLVIQVDILTTQERQLYQFSLLVSIVWGKILMQSQRRQAYYLVSPSSSLSVNHIVSRRMKSSLRRLMSCVVRSIWDVPSLFARKTFRNKPTVHNEYLSPLHQWVQTDWSLTGNSVSPPFPGIS